MKTAIALATLLLASTLAADGTHVLPFAPTTATPVEVHYLSNCVARDHSVRRDGGLIFITALDPQCPNVLPIPVVEKVKLPEVLPVGNYHVTIDQEHEPFFLTGTDFVVRNAGPKPFELHPSAVYGGDDTPIRMTGITCETADCSDITIRVGGEPVQSVTVADDSAIWFVPEAYGQGLVDVTVQKTDFVMISPGALYVLTRRELGAYERILFPVLAAVNGAYGSRWEAQATVSNPSPWTVDAIHNLSGLGPCVGPCDPPIEPKFFGRFHSYYPRGMLFWAPRSEAAHLALSLRIRDVSRQDQGYGTEVPVVREHDFIHGANIHLLDVPLDPRYRVKVRIYMIEPVLAPSRSGVVRIRRGDTLVGLPFTFTRATADYELYHPYSAEVDLPQGGVGERVSVEVQMPLDAIGWAFAAVTNNDTQQVTIVSPQ